MKKEIKILFLLAFCMFSSTMNAKMSENAPITLRRYHPIGGATRPSKAPENNILSLEVRFDESYNVLYFYDEDNNDVSYSIYNSEGSLMTFDVCYFNENNFYSKMVSLQSGTYIIVVFINDVEYHGSIEVNK